LIPLKYVTHGRWTPDLRLPFHQHGITASAVGDRDRGTEYTAAVTLQTSLHLSLRPKPESRVSVVSTIHFRNLVRIAMSQTYRPYLVSVESLGRIACMQCVKAACCYRCSEVCVYLCVDHNSTICCAKTDEPIEMPFGMWTRVGNV